MGRSDKKKNQTPSSLQTTTLEDMGEVFSTDQGIKEAIQNAKDNNIDMNEQISEVERLKKIFGPKP